MEDRFALVSAVHLLLFDGDGRVLLLRRANTGYEDGNLSVPAGHLDGDETVRAASVREALEEIGVTLDLGDLAVALVMHRRSDDERIDFFVTCRRWTGSPVNAEPHKCAELLWCDPTRLPDDVVPYVRAGIEHVAAGDTYAEFGW
ncbi:MAG TPA: NUDIX domain-containing protein [Acidimicrobiales bacterium]|nr:NUDIX domain-containing protein [Acidimicrobiales bacterium]